MNDTVIHKSATDAFGTLAEANTGRLSLPRVTVIVTCFNYGRFVAAALDSVAKQTYPSFDCVVVDDASTDGSAGIAADWIAARGDDRFQLVSHEFNQGQMACIATGLAATRSEFIGLLDADDIWFPEFLTRHIQVHLNRVQPAGLSSSDLVTIDEDGHILGGSTLPPLFINGGADPPAARLLQEDFGRTNDGVQSGEPDPIDARFVFQSFDGWHWSVTSGTVVRRPLLELAMPENEMLRLGADIFLISLCHYLTGSFVIANALGGYRRHGQNNYSSLPVSGGPGSAPSANKEQVQTARTALLHHLLNAFDRLTIVSSPVPLRRLARRLFRESLAQGTPFDNPNLSKVLGRGRVMRDRLRSRIRKLQKKPKQE